MFKERLKMAQKKVSPGEALLITGRHNIKYLSGFAGTNAAILILRSRALFFTDSRYFAGLKNTVPAFYKKINLTDSLGQALKKSTAHLRIGKILFEENDVRFSAYRKLKKDLGNIKPAPLSSAIENLRLVKDRAENILIKKAQKITDLTYLGLVKSLQPGQTETDIAWNLEKLAHNFGADGLSFPPIIAIGKNSATPHHQSSTTRLKKGDLVLIDMGVKYRGYCTDMTRMVFTGSPSSLQKEIYHLVLAAQQTAIRNLKAGMAGMDADRLARDYLKQHRQDKNFIHSLGHGVGLQIHEAPAVGPKSAEVIPAGSVITVEPGIYLKDKFGIRIEDMILVGPKSHRALSGVPKTLESAIHKLI